MLFDFIVNILYADSPFCANFTGLCCVNKDILDVFDFIFIYFSFILLYL